MPRREIVCLIYFCSAFSLKAGQICPTVYINAVGHGLGYPTRSKGANLQKGAKRKLLSKVLRKKAKCSYKINKSTKATHQ